MFNDKPQRGFTFIELLLVISILLSLTLLFTYKKNNDNLVLKNTAYELASAMRLGRRIYESGDANVFLRIIEINGQFNYTVIEKATIKSLEGVIDKGIRLSKKMAYDGENLNNSTGFLEMGKLATEIKYSGTTSTGVSILLDSELSTKKYIITIIPVSSRIHVYELDKQ